MRRSGIVVAVGLFLGVAMVMGGRWSGEQAATADIDRLMLLWPDVMEFKTSDRAFLAGLAMTCRLHTRSQVVDEVVACLRKAAVDPDVVLPKGEDKAMAPAKLEQMLSFAKRR